MLPTNFEGSNIIMKKPEGWTDEQCMEVAAYHGVDNDGHGYILTAWQPSKEDIEAINAGRPIMLKICMGKTMPPVAMYTFDENFEVN